MKNVISNLSPRTKTISIVVLVLLLSSLLIFWLSKKDVSTSTSSTGNSGSSSDKSDDSELDESVFPLNLGSSGIYVTMLQNYLIKNGGKLPVYGVDGKFGTETQAALFSVLKVTEVDAELFKLKVLDNE